MVNWSYGLYIDMVNNYVVYDGKLIFKEIIIYVS